MAEGEAQGNTGNPGGTPSGTPTGQPGQSVLTGKPAGQPSGQPGAGSTGVTLPGWLNEAPEEFRSEKMFHSIKGDTLKDAMPVLMKNYREGQKFIGRSVAIPQQGESPEKKKEFETKINQYRGVPEKVEDYQYEVPEISGQPLNADTVNGFVSRAHKEGFSNRQLQFVLNEYAGLQNQNIQNFQTGLRNGLETLKVEWGPNFSRKAVLAQRFVKEFGSQALLDKLDQTGLGNDPELIRLFAEAGDMAAESGFISGEVAGVEGPEQAKQKIQAILNDPKHPYNDKKATVEAHKAAVAEMERLHQIAHAA